MGKISVILRTATRLGPFVYAGVKGVAALMRDNPELARYGQDLLDRFNGARSGRSRPDRLRRSVALLRTQSQARLAEAEDPAETAQAQRWLAQADRLDDAVELMAIHRGRRQARDAAAVEARVEELFAEIFASSIQYRADRGIEP
ncbi:hypothetical protein [Georgenia sunbinii]|uniref:hypothetical protein n=1 Tax=Georgenia sunbinii TaxID=3117728 RepID=UPI002F26AB6F